MLTRLGLSISHSIVRSFLHSSSWIGIKRHRGRKCIQIFRLPKGRHIFQTGLGMGSITWAVVVAQLVERSLRIPEVQGSNPVSGKNLYWTFTVNCIEKTKIKKKRLGIAQWTRLCLTSCSLGFEPRAYTICWCKFTCTVPYLHINSEKLLDTNRQNNKNGHPNGTGPNALKNSQSNRSSANYNNCAVNSPQDSNPQPFEWRAPTTDTDVL